MNRLLFDSIFKFANRSPFLDSIGIFFASYLPIILILGFIFFVLTSFKKWRMRLFVFGVASLTVILSRGIITEVIRFFYPQPRPPSILPIDPLIEQVGSSFPSGHASFLFALAGILFYFNRRWGILYLTLAALNGVCRIFVGVHWPFDIAAGALVGIVSAISVLSFTRNYLSAIREDKP